MTPGTYQVDSKTVIVGDEGHDFVLNKQTVYIAYLKARIKIPLSTPDDQLEPIVRIYITAHKAFEEAKQQINQYAQHN